MTTRTIRIITALLACVDSVLMAGDKLIAIPSLPACITSQWPTVLFALLIFDRVGHAILDKSKPTNP